MSIQYLLLVHATSGSIWFICFTLSVNRAGVCLLNLSGQVECKTLHVGAINKPMLEMTTVYQQYCSQISEDKYLRYILIITGANLVPNKEITTEFVGIISMCFDKGRPGFSKAGLGYLENNILLI